MKLFVFIAIALLVASCFISKKSLPVDDPSLGEIDPRQPVYQDGVQKRLKVMDWKLMHQIELSNRGLKMVEWGAIAFAVGVAVCLAFHNALIDTIGSCIGFFGGGSVGIGLGLMWISEIWIWVCYGLTIASVIGLIVYFRGRGVKLKKSKKEIPC